MQAHSGRNTHGAIWPILRQVAHTMTLPSLVDQGDIQVLGALLDEMPEATLLGRSIPNLLHVAHEPSRGAVLARIRTGDYAAVVFPIFDGSGLPTAPLIQQCAQEHSDLALIAICCAPPARAGALLAAARAGARVVVAPSAPELAALLNDVSRRAVQRVAVTQVTLDGVEPPFLREVLAIAVRTVLEGGHVATFAGYLNISTRTLSRRLHNAGIPSARALLAAARVLRACAARESVPCRDAATTARLAGFANTHRLMRTARQYAVPVGADLRHPSLPPYGDALVAVVGVLGGHVER
jgi:hypothetical protein